MWRTRLAGPLFEFVLHWPNIGERVEAHGVSTLAEKRIDLSHLCPLFVEEVAASENLRITGTIPTEIGSLSQLRKY